MNQCYATSLPLVGGHTDEQFLQAHSVVAGPESVSVQLLTTGAQSVACVYGYARLVCRCGDIDYYRTNIEYEKNRV